MRSFIISLLTLFMGHLNSDYASLLLTLYAVHRNGKCQLLLYTATRIGCHMKEHKKLASI